MKGKQQKIFIALVMAILLSAPLSYLLKLRPVVLDEHQKPFSLSDIDPDNLGFDINRWMAENNGLRDMWVYTGGRIKAWFHSSPLPRKAAYGKNEFCFLADDLEFNSYTHRNFYDSNKMEKRWRSWEWNQNQSKGFGSIFIKAVFPNKSTLYAEFLPISFKWNVVDKPSLLDQSLEIIKKEHPGIELVDVRQELTAAKSTNPIIYRRYDTHWNAHAAFIAYRKLFSQLAAHDSIYYPLKTDDFVVSYETIEGGDLLRNLGRLNSEKLEILPKYHPISPRIETQISNPTEYNCEAFLHKNSTGNGKKAIFFCDSYIYELMPFIDLHFSEVLYLKRTTGLDIIEQQKPDVVVECYVERYMR